MTNSDTSSRSSADEPKPSTDNSSRKNAVLVIDALRLRRRFAVSMLEEWLSGTGIFVRWTSTDITPTEQASCFDYKLILLNLGGRHFSEPATQHLFDSVLETFEHSPLAVISDFEEPKDVLAALTAGAKGFIPNALDPEIAKNAILFIMEGGTYFPPSVLLKLDNKLLKLDTTPAASATGSENVNNSSQKGVAKSNYPDVDLTSRQQDVVMLLQQGLPNKVIARHLGMTEATVKVHVRQVMRKLGADNRTQVVLRLAAMQQNTIRNNVSISMDDKPKPTVRLPSVHN